MKGVVATTKPMTIYGGFQFTEAEVRRIVEMIEKGTLPIGMHHDPRVSVSVDLMKATLEIDEEGFLLAALEVEVDQAEWEERGGSSVGGWSVSVTRRLPGTGHADSPAIQIAADAHWYSDEEIAAASQSLGESGLEIDPRRLYQFSIDPTSLLTVTFYLHQLAGVPVGLLTSYVYDALKRMVGRSDRKSRFCLDFDNETGLLTRAYLETESEDVLKLAVSQLPELIEKQGRYEYSIDEEGWVAT
jgi:hypothetical protein